MKTVEVAVARPVTVTMVSVAVALFGWLALRGLPLDLLPDISYPTLTVRTTWEGAAPAEIESLVSRPLEQAVGAIPNVVRLSSVSAPERSDVTVEFDWGTSMEFAALDVREKVDLVTLPEDADRPVLLRYDPSLEPVIEAAVAFAEGNPTSAADETRLRDLADERVARGLEGLDGVAAVTVQGGLESEFHVVVDVDRLASLELTVAQVSQRLAAENVNQTGGAVEDGDARFLVRTLNEFGEPEEALDVVVGQRDGVPVRLRDVGRVERGARDRKVLTRVDGRPSVRVAVFREAEANTVAVADAVRARLEELERELQDQGLPVQLSVVVDQSRFIRASIAEVRSAALWGGALALLVLYVFLRRLSATFIIGIAIPVSVLATFFAMDLSSTTLNVLSLGGLALGIGMLVDSAIVVLEAIEARRGRSGGTPRETAERGASEVGRAVVASTLTTICVFVPVLFVEGIGAALFRDMAVVVSVSLLASLLASLTLIPTLSARWGLGAGAAGSAGVPPTATTWLSWPLRLARGLAQLVSRAVHLPVRPVLALFDGAFGLLERGYPRLLAGALRHRAVVLSLVVAVAAGTAALVPGLDVDLLPEMSQGELRVDVALPVGTPIETAAARLAAIERSVLADPDVVAVAATVGRSLSRPGQPAEEREHLAHLVVRLRDGVLGAAEDEVAARLDRELAGWAAVAARFERPALFSFSAPLEVELRGENLVALARAAESVARRLEALPSISGVTTGARGGNPEIQVRFDRDRLAALGTGTAAAGEALRDQVLGAVATDLQRGDRDVDLRVRADEAVRHDVEQLQDLPVVVAGGTPVPLRAIARLETARGPAEITRRGHERVALVAATPRSADLAGVVEDVESVLHAEPLPAGVHWTLSGKASELGSSLRNLGLAIVLATFLVYLVMASQFESFAQPFVILFSVPFALAGGLLALRLLGQPLSVVAGIGLVMLSGIVVNNAIVLVDRINQRAADHELAEAVALAGRDRLRPILMTTSTTVLGLLPMALSSAEGAELRIPLALTVIGGLLLSTLVTLVLVPVLVSFVGAGGSAARRAPT